MEVVSMKRNKKQMQILSLCISMVMLILSACGKAEEPVEVMADEAEIEVEAEPEIEEPTIEEKGEEEGKEEETEAEETEEIEEPLAMVPYYEEKKLEFCKDTSLTIQGTRADINNEDDIEQVDAEWIIKSIDISDPENGFQTITIQHECTGYLWTDQSSRFLFNISMPSARYCDLNSGKCFPTIILSEDGKMGYQTMVEWDGQSYEINYTEGVEWNDGTEWTPDGKGGYILPSTMCITDTFVVSEGYEGLGMILSPLALDAMSDKSYGVHDEQEFFIHEILELDEGSIPFDMMDIYKILKEDSAVDDVSNKENSITNAETPKENSTSTNSSNTTPKQDDKKEQQSTHTHSYTSSVTKNPTCSEEGIRTYTCSSCGASYNEPIAKTDHNWVPITESVYHPSTGHYETVTKKELYCNCGATFGSMDELNAHTETHTDGDPGRGVRETSENVWIVDQPEYYADEVTGYQCSVCGARQ